MKAQTRAKRIRFKLKQNAASGAIRLSVFKSINHICVQAIDDSEGKTIASFGSDMKVAKEKKLKGIKLAEYVGSEIAKKLKSINKVKVFFDRGGYAYHGKVKALADAARNNGLEF